jgi:hypothetical protein
LLMERTDIPARFGARKTVVSDGRIFSHPVTGRVEWKSA